MITDSVLEATGALSERTLAVDDDIRPRQLTLLLDSSQSAPHRLHLPNRAELLAGPTTIDPNRKVSGHTLPISYSTQNRI